ncbi:hypothetical protein LCGC14_2824630, partial [marine sediment metagenome]
MVSSSVRKKKSTPSGISPSTPVASAKGGGVILASGQIVRGSFVEAGRQVFRRRRGGGSSARRVIVPISTPIPKKDIIKKPDTKLRPKEIKKPFGTVQAVKQLGGL